MDEVVVSDPVLKETATQDAEALRGNKEHVAQLLSVLNVFRQSLETGYVLLAGPPVAPPAGDQPPAIVGELLRLPDLLEALDRTVRFGMDKRPDSDGKESVVFTAHLDYTFVVGGHLRGLRQGLAGPPMRVGETLPNVSAAELSAAIEGDALEHARGLYPTEVHRVLHAAAVAQSTGCAVLFDRPVDGLVLELARHPHAGAHKQAAVVGGLNLSLPYLRGVPPQRLVDAREALPGAFAEFRGRMADIVTQAMHEDPENADAVAGTRAERELVGSLDKLTVELRTAARRARLLGYGLPASSAVAAVVGAVFGAPAALLVELLAGGTAAALKAQADWENAKAAASLNPFYFVWHAQQESAGA